MEVSRPRNTEINLSMQSLLGFSTLWSMFLPVETYASIAQQSGYRGLEGYPTNFLPNLQMTHKGLLTKNALAALQSLHQPHRMENGLKDAWAHPNRTFALANLLISPHRTNSLHDLAQLQSYLTRMMGRPTPVVVYPEESLESDNAGIFKSLTDKLAQPTPESVARHGSIEGYLQYLTDNNSRVCLDLLHIRREGLPHWEELIPLLLPHTDEIHVAAGRRDFQLPHSDSVAELVDLYTGSDETEIISMLEAIKTTGWKGSIVTEIPGDGVKEMLKITGVVTPSQIIQAHKRITSTIGDIFFQ